MMIGMEEKKNNGMEVKHSCKTLGVSCAVMAIISAAGGHVGQEDKLEGRLCTIK